MPERDVILTVFQTGIALAGLLLVFVGFLISKAGAMTNTKRATPIKWFARSGLLPIIFSLACSWISLMALKGDPWAGSQMHFLLKTMLISTGVYAAIAMFLSD